MEEKKKEEKIGEALLKVALGYQVSEVTEEYAEVDGTLKLTKRKKTKKDVPPDLKAVQMLLAEDAGGGFVQWSDEDLEAEKVRLMALLKETETQKETTVKKTAVKKTVAKKTVVKKPAAKKRTAAKKGTKKTGRNGNDV